MSDNSGPAFPVPNDANVNGQEGMTLRDYFAAQALAGLIAQSNGTAMARGSDPDIGADFAYRMAEAMLSRRAKANKEEGE